MTGILGEFPKNEKVSDWLQEGYTIELARKELTPIAINGKSYDDIRTYLENIAEDELDAFSSLHCSMYEGNSLQHALLDFQTHRNKWYVTEDNDGVLLLHGEIYYLYVCKWNDDYNIYDAMFMYKRLDFMSEADFSLALFNIRKMSWLGNRIQIMQ